MYYSFIVFISMHKVSIPLPSKSNATAKESLQLFLAHNFNKFCRLLTSRKVCFKNGLARVSLCLRVCAAVCGRMCVCVPDNEEQRGKRDFYRNSIEFPLHYATVLSCCGTNRATFVSVRRVNVYCFRLLFVACLDVCVCVFGMLLVSTVQQAVHLARCSRRLIEFLCCLRFGTGFA